MPAAPPRINSQDGRRAVLLGRVLWAARDRAALSWFAAAIGLVLLGSAIATLGPWLLKRLVDALALQDPTAPAGLAAAYVAAAALQRFAEQAQGYAYGRGEQRLLRRVNAAAYDHLLRLPLGLHVDRRSGTLAQALNEGALGARLVLTHALMTVAPAVAQLTMASLVLAAVFGPPAAALLGALLGAYAAAFGWNVRNQADAARHASAAQLRAAGIAADGLMNVETLKAFTAEARYTIRYADALAAREVAWRGFLARRLEGGLVIAVLFLVLLGGVTAAGIAAVADGRSSLGGFVLLNAYMLQLVRPLEMLGFAVRDVGQGLAYLDGLAALLEAPAEPEGTDGAVHAPEAVPSPAEVAFRDVDFRYGGQGAGLARVSFRVAPGRFLGIVGASGAGKSTLLRLLLRFHDPDGGEIMLDGRDVRRLPLRELRGQIALIPQETILLHDTVGANIALAAEAPQVGDVEAAAHAAQLGEWVAGLPLGLDTPVGERGLRLSGGEKQRVAIARAALRRARVVLCDEATAALDAVTERAVWRSLRGMAGGATILAVTHRLATVTEADEILVLEAGRIAERGRHGELMARDGSYRRLWLSQAGA